MSAQPQTTQQALQRALSIAEAERNETLLRNLRWYRERLAHRSYAAIARADGKVPATVRTGVARARKFLLSVVHDLQHEQPAPLNGEAPAELEPLRRLWFEQDLERLARELEHTRSAYGEDPHWLNLAALLAADRGQRDQALRLYERALVGADAPGVRGRVLNNLGNLFDDEGGSEHAWGYWLRAHQLLPAAPAPLLNLLAAASVRRDYASAQHFVCRLSDLVGSGKLSADERAYLMRRLAQHPKLAWLRDTDAWRSGPARWLRATRTRLGTRRAAATAAALLAAAALFVPLRASAYPARSSSVGSEIQAVRLRTHASLRLPAEGGDSMGLTDRPKPRRPPRVRR